ncbi:uncharacterized protein [Emydura macquarii macquarii]|uniref:uncharacterized protein n=1 Tax=Emydura macquarii macquarii TaxID=1129001 RepID=UPI00352BA9DF
MLFTKYLLLSFTVIKVQSFLQEFQPFLFVNINDTAKIQCSYKEKLVVVDIAVQWYKRREGEAPFLFKRCSDNQQISKVACVSEGHTLTLEIRNVQRSDSGVYYCTDSHSIFLTFSKGSTLIVGDSYTTSSQVLPLAPSPRSLLSNGTADLACLVYGVSNPVQISWSVSEALQEEGLMHSLKAKDGSSMFINHISIPMEIWTSGKNFTCEVKFNSSGKSVKKVARYIEATCVSFLASSTAPARECTYHIVGLAAGAGLLLLLVSLSLVWALCPSILGFQPRISAPPASQEHPDGILYAHLDFDSRNHNRRKMQRSARGKSVKP